MRSRDLRVLAAGMALLIGGSTSGQTPQPFPRPAGSTPSAQAPPPQPPRTAPAPPATPPASPATPPSPPAQPAAPRATVAGEPDPATLGVPMYPDAQFLSSYDAGRGQRYYLYGTAAPFAELVTFYRMQLRERGNLVFEEPPTHMFEVGRFRDETMAFPPGITVKDWTSGGSQGYPNPRRGATPSRFATVLMIVPPPPAAAPIR